jgi:anti-sigma factor RsiW
MSAASPRIPEDDLHAYVDGMLDAGRRLDIAVRLQANPEDAARVGIYSAQRETLRAAFNGHDMGPMPARLDPRVILRQRASARQAMWRMAASVFLALSVGGGGGWMLHERLAPPPNTITVLVQDAVANHVVYTADRRRPTELGADQRDDLARWVSNRMNHQVAPPDLASYGYKFIGGRLAATPRGPAGMFMYQNDQNVRMTVFVQPVGTSPSLPLERIETGPIESYAWVDNGIGYSVSGSLPPDELNRVAKQVRDGLAKPG